MVRLWLVVVTLAAFIAGALVLALPRPLGGEVEREVGARLSRAQQAARLLLKVTAREWIDRAGQSAADAVLVESLDQASRGPADLTMIHKTVAERLRALGDQLHADLMIATDGKGRVIARAGVDEAVYKDGVEGLPVVADALRGYRADDTWSLGGRLYRVAAAPVISRDHRYAGALVVGQEMAANLAASMKRELDTDVAFVLRGRVVASSTEAAPLAQLAVLVDDELAAGHTGKPRPLGSDHAWLASAAPIVGQAAGHKAALVVMAPSPIAAGVGGLVIGALQRGSAALSPVEWGAIGGGLVVALLIGFLLTGATARPLDRMSRDAQALARGEIHRLDDGQYPGRLATVARAVNTALDRVASRASAAVRAASETGAQRALRDDAARRESAPAPTPAPPAPPPPRRESQDLVDVGLGFDQATMRGRRPTAQLEEERRPSLPVLAATGAVSSFGDETTRTASTAERNLMLERDAAVAAADPPPPEIEAVPDDGLQDELEAVFHEFLETKQRLGESTDGVTLDKFVAKLRSNREQLISKHGARTVKFAVYIKDGKAALRATPEK
jgi:hypothetical protein